MVAQEADTLATLWCNYKVSSKVCPILLLHYTNCKNILLFNFMLIYLILYFLTFILDARRHSWHMLITSFINMLSFPLLLCTSTFDKIKWKKFNNVN